MLGLPLDDVLEAEPPGSAPLWWLDGAPYTLADATADLRGLLPGARRRRRRADRRTLPTYLRASAGQRTLDRLSAARWIDTRVPGGARSRLGRLLANAYTEELGARSRADQQRERHRACSQGTPRDRFSPYEESDQRFHVRGGNDRIVSALASRLDDRIETGTRLTRHVARCHRAATGCASRATPRRACRRVDRVILALPFSLLRDVDLAQAGFRARKLTAIRTLGMGINTKLQLQFASRSWRARGGNGETRLEAPFNTSWDVTRAQPGDAGILNFFSGGSVARRAGDASPETQARTALAGLEPLYPGIGAQWTGAVIRNAWDRYPWTRGSYCAPEPGQYTAFHGIEWEPEGHVYFAGEHTSDEASGYMEGAVESGQRAAGEVLESLALRRRRCARRESQRPQHEARRARRDSLLAQRSFVLFWCSRVATMIAQQMITVAVGWQVYAMTGRALDLGFVGLAQFLPAFLLVLVSGQVADRFDRRRDHAGVHGGGGAGRRGPDVRQRHRTHRASTPSSCSSSRSAPRARSRCRRCRRCCPHWCRRRCCRAPSRRTRRPGQTAIIVGPALGGLIYVAGPGVVYGDEHGAPGRSPALARASHPLVHAPADARKVTLESVFAGIHYIREKPALLGAISLDLFAVLLGGAAALLPIYARDILHTGPWGLGLLRSRDRGRCACRWPCGSCTTRSARRAGRTMLLSVAVFGVGTIVFGLSSSFALSLAGAGVLGAADMVSVVIRQTLVQLQTPDAMRGRVGAVNALFIGTSNQLGEFESGVTAAWFGVVPSVVIGGVGTLVIVLLWTRLFPALAKTDRLEAPRA